MSIHKIAVIGGTGKSGTYLVEALLQKGYALRVLLRNPGKNTLSHPNIDIVTGDARDPGAIAGLVVGCQAVVSTLGQPQGESPIFRTATANVIQALKASGPTRYIVTTGLNVDTEGDQKDAPARAATEWMYAHYPATTHDKQREYELLAGSDLAWTLVRLPRIILTEERKAYRADLRNCPGDQIGAADLAAFVVAQLQEDTYVQKSPFLANV